MHLDKFDLAIIDDPGYVSHEAEMPKALFTTHDGQSDYPVVTVA